MFNKKKIIVLVGLIILFAIGGILVNVAMVLKNSINEKNNASEIIKQENTLSMMIEQTAGTGDYILEARTSWPKLSDGYKFNESLSICENGSTLSWDSTNCVVTMTGNVSDKCYVYFDKIFVFTFLPAPSFESTRIAQGTLYLNDVDISDKIGNVIEYNVGDVLKYENNDEAACNWFDIYDADNNKIETLTVLSGTAEYVMTGSEVSINSYNNLSNWYKSSGSLSGGGAV